MKWKDTTTYSRRDRATKEPTTWSITGKYIRITITKSHINCPGYWVMHCYKLGINTLPIAEDTFAKELVQKRAIETVKAHLKVLSEEIEKLQNDT